MKDNETTLEMYYVWKTDIDYSRYLERKPNVEYFYDMENKDLKQELARAREEMQEGLYYKGFEICFKLGNELYYISHYHKSDDFIHKIGEILKKYGATNILINYGELD